MQTEVMSNSPKSIVWRDYLELCKPRVVLLMLLTVLVGMYMAAPGWVDLSLLFSSLMGIGFCAGSAAAINHLVDRHIDSIMARTKKRPVAHGRVSVIQALIFAAVMGALGLTILVFFVNQLTALLTFITLIGYAGVYTGYLKRATSQNIVIGGLAGAAPPLLGWTAVTNHLDPQALLFVLIIFTWTPPHFWALAIYRFEEYQHAQIPMLPVTHGIQFTKLNIYLYTILLLVVSLLPFMIGMSGGLYLLGATALGLRFLWWAHKLYHTEKSVVAMQTFRFSIVYLMLLFVFLLLDHYFKVLL
ncbi:MAG: protoheme IX farnesyltransferase [Legionella sp.]|nr:MAG: protoheme IX farnesyltransferase [Legionella sp.]